MSLKLAAVAGVAALAAISPGAAKDAKPVWRNDTSHLSDDLKEIRSCFISAVQHTEGIETQCADLPRSACQTALGEDAAMTTLGQRQCNWRAIAAWEDILAEAVAELHTEQNDEERKAFDEAESAWERFVEANVRAHAEPFRGGTLTDVVAGTERARMAAERALEVRQMLRLRREG